MRKLMLLAALAVVSAPISVIAEDCKQSGDHQGNNSGCTVNMKDGDAVGLTAGTAALIKQAHPGWTPDQIKAAIVNTALQTKVGGYNSRVAGSGAVQPRAS